MADPGEEVLAETLVALESEDPGQVVKDTLAATGLVHHKAVNILHPEEVALVG
jgi:hypothetical protein